MMDYATFLKSYFSKEFIDSLLIAQDQEPISGLRLNPQKLPPASFYLGLAAHPIVPNGFLFDKKTKSLGKHPYHQAGAYYIQEPSAMMVAKLLDIQKDDFVIDLCAAPGGKSTYAATFLDENGLLLANDFNHSRALDLCENIERMGIENAIVTNEPVAHLADMYAGNFDRVILDAPCSGEGMFRKNQLAKEDWSEDKVHRLSELQKQLIIDAYRLLKKDGYLIYSTCTFNPLENEEVIKHLLANTNASLVNLPTIPNIDRGLEMNEALRIFPTHFCGEGHFIALVKCNDDNPTEYANRKDVSIDKKSLQIFHTFVKNNLNRKFEDKRLFNNNSHLYYLPKNGLRINGIRTLKNGLYLGEIRDSYFIPSHALALASKKEDWQRSVSLASDDQRLISYLSGASFNYQNSDGFALVLCENLSIGFCKISKNILKNYYPKNLRKQRPCWSLL